MYNGFGNLVKEYQAVSGTVNQASTPCVQYTYSDPTATGTGNQLSSMIYPNGQVLTYNYNSGIDRNISRLTRSPKVLECWKATPTSA